MGAFPQSLLLFLFLKQANLVDFEKQGVANMLRLPFQDHQEACRQGVQATSMVCHWDNGK